jgi:flagellar capping protein FliD
VTLTLTKKDPTKTVLVEVTESADEAKSQLDGFVKAYNDLMSFITEQGRQPPAKRTLRGTRCFARSRCD